MYSNDINSADTNASTGIDTNAGTVTKANHNCSLIFYYVILLNKIEKNIVNYISRYDTKHLYTVNMSDLDLKVELRSYRPHDAIKRGQLELNCSGEDCNEQFINGLGRIAVERLPMYAYAKGLIKIERINPESGYHDSVPFNHDMMRMRLENTPVMNVDPGFAILHERFWKNVDYRSPDRPVHENEKRIEVYIDSRNTAPEGDSESILHVTTNDIKVYIDDEPAEIYDKEYPLLIISLKPKEAFKCSMRAVLGVGVNHTCWDACSNFCFDQETDPDVTIAKFQSASQFDEFVLIDRAIEYYRTRANLLKDEIHRMYLLEKEPTERFQIEIMDEDHTMGEPINYELQSHPDIHKSSNSKPDHLMKKIVLDIVAYDKDKLLNAILESMDNLIAKIDKFEEEFNKIERPDGSSKGSSGSKKASSKTTSKTTTKSGSKSAETKQDIKSVRPSKTPAQKPGTKGKK
ncbi:DNA-dependent RNA polymerase 2 subunit Rpb3 [Yasminevirus sp. GU-2018]|uniref:DNA-dependent RNA polymerase 2 subunit Rpb3 n=1 Tax=Yasminevirus sp. GU-2018 TaxID=2420051 RepID=A0A5K0U872_9VIRU|nr:DNA-dependent RNA polymerase 2 subunit Rpb3 [Yasminevirus sp. GU-2018]